MATAWEVFDVCDKEIILDAGKHPKSFIFLNCRWRIDEKIAFRTIQLLPENILYTEYNCYNLRNRMVMKN